MLYIDHSFSPAPAISIQITTSGAPTLGQTSYSLTCSVSVSEILNPSVTYQWTKKNSIQSQLVVGNSSFLSFSRLQPSDTGQYSCNVAVLSAYLSSVVYASKSFEVTIISMFQRIINEHGPILGHQNFAS